MFSSLDQRIPQNPEVRKRLGIIVLIAMCAIWGTTFPAQKMLSQNQLSAVQIMFLRFGLATLVLIPVFFKLKRVEVIWGLLLSVFYFAGFWLQTEGLVLTSSNRNAFITGLSVLAVPMLSMFIGHAPTLRLWLACAMAAGGMYLLFYQQEPWNLGDTLTVGAMLCFALYIIVLEKSAEKNAAQPLSALGIVAVQCAVMVLGSGTLLLVQGELGSTFEKAQQLPSLSWITLIYLAVVASAFSPAMQVWGQRYVSAVQSALIYGLEPVFAAITAWFWIDERLSTAGLMGAVLIVAALLYSQLPERKIQSL